MIPMFSVASVLQRVDRFADERTKKLVMTLAFIGESATDDARLNSGNRGGMKRYKNDTRNLRGSLAWAVVLDGQIQKQGFPDSTAMGQNMAKETIANVMSNSGLELIGVAGMEYAAAFESKGYDVITGSVPTAEELIKFFKLETTE